MPSPGKHSPRSSLVGALSPRLASRLSPRPGSRLSGRLPAARRIGIATGIAAVTAVLAMVAVNAFAASAPAGLPGLDVSSHQGNVNWSSVKSAGAAWAYVKATEGTGYTNPYFTQQYNGSYNVGLIRGAYHFALPDRSGGAAQADYFAAHGGGWSADGKTLPGAVDLEYNPYGATCYGLSQSGMVNWISAFVNEYRAKTRRWATIYTTTDWWKTCTGNYSGFAANNPLWIARYSSSVGTLPAGWPTYSFWQWADSGRFPGDQNVWNGSLARLKVMACDGTC